MSCQVSDQGSVLRLCWRPRSSSLQMKSSGLEQSCWELFFNLIAACLWVPASNRAELCWSSDSCCRLTRASVISPSQCCRHQQIPIYSISLDLHHHEHHLSRCSFTVSKETSTRVVWIFQCVAEELYSENFMSCVMTWTHMCYWSVGHRRYEPVIQTCGRANTGADSRSNQQAPDIYLQPAAADEDPFQEERKQRTRSYFQIALFIPGTCVSAHKGS